MTHNNLCYDYYCSEDHHNYTEFDPNPTSLSSSSSYVDCTLSLGTPSTRSETNKQSSRRKWWDLASKHSADQSHSCEVSEPVVTMRCGHCGTDSTPLWRKGPNGPKSLCNACGIRYKKEERRRAAALESHQASNDRYYTNHNEHQGNAAVSAFPWMLNIADHS